ncbi:MAG: hypothetical protein A2Z24_00290 [Candidatus Woykebacteria bacterium RBG_16_44_10]|uniref:Uncharacterized protein n=1 Tax=Candidatus Woykebacteria bacterium RBG_16_44_10 TaxID=1802597 RepID=A0A1G1WFU3_9BACT|nr:MAG: hypothetical protein A2Z24_00290 [Candidatus Woykebacteria bacterium RBG_16_44_10]
MAAIVAIGTGTLQIGSAQADNSHVEYVVEPQPGISVVQHGKAGLVEVTVTDCLTAAEPFTFTMLISSTREGSSALSVRKNSGTDISSWFSLSPAKVQLPGETTVTVSITPPGGTELTRKAVARIQEIGDPPAPGGHHGVKVRVDCVKQPTPTPPGATPTPPPTAINPPAQKSPTPEAPKFFPETGGEPPADNSSTTAQAAFLGFGTTLALVGLGLFLEGRRHRIF